MSLRRSSAAAAEGPGRALVSRVARVAFRRVKVAELRPGRGATPGSRRAALAGLAALVALALASFVSAGCAKKSGSADGSATSASPAPAVSSGRERSQAFITAGNDAYRAGDFELALKRYAAAAVADPRDPAAYFGMGMTFTRLKREDEARAAYARAQQLAREEEAAGTSH